MAHTYSKIKAIEVQDFRNIGHVLIDFTQSNIVCLKGGNEAGKSSIVLAMKSLGSNLNSKQYKEYIRTGTDGWTVMIYTEDNKAVYRRKTAKGQSYGIYNIHIVDGEPHYELEWSIDKLDENAVPKEVQEIIGMTYDPDSQELLNIRTYADQLLFVDTPSSANYKVMYNALKIDNLSKAVKCGSDEVRGLKEELDRYNTSIETCKDEIKKVKLIDTESLQKIKNRILSESKVVEKAMRVSELKDEVDAGMRVTKVFAEVSALDTLDASKYEKAIEARNKLRDYQIVQKKIDSNKDVLTLTPIDIELKTQLDKGVSLSRALKAAGETKLSEVATLTELNVEALSQVRKAIELKNYLTNTKITDRLAACSLPIIDGDTLVQSRKAVKLLSEIREAENTVTSIHDALTKASEMFKASGTKYVECPNCGEIILEDET